MAKICFFAILALFAIVAVSADAQAAAPAGQVPAAEEYGWSCTIGGNAGCSASCAAQGHWKGGHCNSANTCICN
ncbi:hypothetical protein KPH14_009561 [Odynerus spinipes]|uniref:Defensin n=1 Tax=Odynerus spinipes TaxID=1348599 RepID=A0AAD9VQU3_9HYME|nr:hypothetical protein KPH14_009561 [Odynerus spinipes]